MVQESRGRLGSMLDNITRGLRSVQRTYMLWLQEGLQRTMQVPITTALQALLFANVVGFALNDSYANLVTSFNMDD